MLSDALISPSYFKFLYGYDPKWVFALIGSSKAAGNDEIGRIEGRIYTFNLDRWRGGRDPHGSFSSPRTAVDDLVFEVDKAGADPVVRGLKFSQLIPETMAVLEGAAVFSVSFDVTRQGVATISDAKVHPGAQFSASILTEPHDIGEADIRYLCNQAYFFLKDIAHNHRHHPNKSDTITAAHPQDDQHSWIRETQYSIHRRIIAQRRARTPRSLYDALGLMAYMASFAKTAETLDRPQAVAPARRRLTPKQTQLPDLSADQFEQILRSALNSGPLQPTSSGARAALAYNLKETEESIKAELEATRWRRVQWNIVVSAIPALMVALMSALKPAAGSSEKAVSFFDYLRHVIIIGTSGPLYGTLFLVTGLSLIPLLYGVPNMRRFGSVLIAKRVLTVGSQDRQVTLLASLGWLTIATALALPLLWWARPSIDWLALAWILTGVAAISVFSGPYIVPYLLTIPDLWQRLRLLGREGIKFPSTKGRQKGRLRVH